MRQTIVYRLTIALGIAAALSSAVWAAATPADQAFTAAKQLLQTGHDQQAAAELRKFIAAYPDDTRIHEAAYLLGRGYQQDQQLDKALTMYAQVISKATGPDFASLRAATHYQMAECYQMRNEYEKAVRCYGYCLQLSAKDADMSARARYWRAESLYQLGRYDEALADYRKVAADYPAHALAAWAEYSVGMTELRRARYSEAIASLERVIKSYTTSEVTGEATLALGFAYTGRAQQAADPAAKDRDLHSAATVLETLVDSAKLPPSTLQRAAVALARVYLDQKVYDKAAAMFATAINAMPAGDPQTLQAHLWRGHALYNAGQYKEAVTEYGQVAEDKAAGELQPEALYWMANSQYQLARQNKLPAAYTAAIAAARRFLALPNPAPAQASLVSLLVGLSYEDLAARGDADARTAAIDALKTVLQKWPASREANEAQAALARMTGTMKADELRTLAGTLPAGAIAWNVTVRLAREDFLAGKYDSALAGATRVLDGKPTGDLLAQAAYLAGASLQQLGRAADAIARYQQVLVATNDADLRLGAQRGLTQAFLDAKRYTEGRDAALALLKLPVEAQGDEAQKERAIRLLYLAEAYTGNQQPAEALAVYRRIIDECAHAPLVPNAIMGAAWTAEARKDRQTAIEQYRALIAQYPDHALVPEAFFRLGVNLADGRDYDNAIAAFRNVAATHRLADQAAYAIAWALKDSGKGSEADAQFATLAERYPDSPLAVDSLYRIGEDLLDQKRYADASRQFNRALEKGAGSTLAPLLTYKLGVSAFYAQDYLVAADAFGKVTANFPTSEYAADSYFWKGQALERLGSEKALLARDAYTQYQTRFPAGAFILDATVGAGRAALAAKQYAPARTDLQKALTLCSDLGQNANPAQVERAKNVAPEAQYLLAQSYFEEKNYDAAVKEYAKVAVYAYEPWYSQSMLQMARCSAVTGDRAAAQRTLQLLMQYFPKSTAAQQAAQVAAEYALELPAAE